jgi:protein SCO1/2
VKSFYVTAFIGIGSFLSCKTGNNDLPFLGPENHVVPDFQFINQNGDTSGSELLEEKIFVADFFFTRCMGICPKMTSEMKRVQEAYSGNENLKLVSFTVDPERDSSEVLSGYMEQYGADPGMWTMYTGDKKELYQLARSGFFITAVEGDGGEEDFIHSEKLVLVDAQKKIRGYYDGTNPESVDQLIVDIGKLLGK